jgi:ribosomal protein S5
MNATVEAIDTVAIAQEMRLAASKAAQDYVNAWIKVTGGNAYGEPAYCGFAWVTVYPAHKGNTRAGKSERAVLESMGFRKDWTGKAYELWNPSGWNGQSMDVKEAGARAAADVLKRYGFAAYMGSRAD